MAMTERSIELPDGRRIAVDEKGYLLDTQAWDMAVAEYMAGTEGVDLTPDHFEVLDIFREYFAQHEIEPPMRALVRIVAARMGEEKANSRFLYRLFPEGPTTQASRYAGLPRPLSCM